MRSLKSSLFGLLALCCAVAVPISAKADVVINEVCASSDDQSGALKDEMSDGTDWVELRNTSSSSVNIGGYTISDGSTSYTLPSATISGNGYYIVFLSGAKGLRSGNMHAPFQISMKGGETISISGGGKTSSKTLPRIPYGYSYGLIGDGSSWGYFATPTPKAKNSSSASASEAVEPVTFSPKRGIYTSAQTVTLSTKTSGATIYYSTDGSVPSKTYSGPISVSDTTVIRAIAKKSGAAYNSNAFEASTYIFIDKVASQGAPSGASSSWAGGNKAKWNVDLNNGVNASNFKSALQAIPIVSLSAPIDALFSGSSSLYGGSTSAKQCNIEWVTFPGNSSIGYSANQSINFSMGGEFKLYGAGGAGWNRTVKKSLRVTFRAKYGSAKIKGYNIFDNMKSLASSSCAGKDDTEFKSLIFRGEHNNAWSTVDSINDLPMVYIKDQFIRDLERQISGYGSNGNWVHLFLNGRYWGVYNVCERPDAEMETKHHKTDAGHHDDWISAKGNNGSGWSVHDSASKATGYTYSDLKSRLDKARTSASSFSSYSTYSDAIKFIDPMALANYMNLNYWNGNYDWPYNNWYLVGSPRNGIPVRYYTWDSESAWDSRATGGVRMGQLPTGTGRSWDNGTTDSPQFPQLAFEKSPDFRLCFYDAVYNTLIKSDGPLTYNSAKSRLQKYFSYGQTFLRAEQARWGNYRGSSDRYSKWVSNGNNLLNSQLSGYVSKYISKLQSYGLYPKNTSGASWTVSGDKSYATLSIPSGCTVYYTTDGSDPRKPGSASDSSKSDGVKGSANTNAKKYSSGTKVYGSTSKILKARTVNSSGQWSYLTTCEVTSGSSGHTHSFGAWSTVKAATCTEDGSQKRTCSCGQSETQTIPASGHSYGAATENPKATCTTAGKRTATCTRCNKTVTEDVPALGHTWGDWVVDTEATTTSAGKRHHTCSVCKVTEYETIPIKGRYTYGAVDTKACYYTLQTGGDWADPEIWKKSSAATYGIPSNSLARTEIPSSLTSSVVVDLGGATYMTAALTNKSTKGVTFQNGTIKSYGPIANSAAGKVTFKNITMTSGSTSTDKRLTMDVEGMTFGFEGNNDLSARTLRVRYSGTLAFKDGFTDFGTANAWDPASYANTVTMTFDNARIRANTSLSTPKAFAITIKMGSNNTTANAVMDLTGTFAPAAGSTLTIDASAVSAGEYRILSCGTFTDTASIVKNAKITAPSGVQAQLTTAGNVVTLVVGGHVHNWGAWNTTKAATCLTDGSRTRTCLASDCPVKTQTEVIPALGHDWDSGIVTKAATASTTGIRTFTCKRSGCGATRTEIIPITGGDSDLPAGYTRIKYVESKANGYFKSGIKVSQAKYFDVESKFSITDPSAVNESEYIFRDGNALNRSWLFGACTTCSYSGTGGGSDMWGPICWNMCWFQPRRASGVSHYDTRPRTKDSSGNYIVHTVRNIYNGSVTSSGGIIKRGMFWYNGSEVNERYTDSGYVGGYSTAGLDREIYVFACNRNGSVSDRCHARIYTLVIKGRASSKDTIATLFNGIPCKNTDGVAGMYDTVSKKFFKSLETPFIAGPEDGPSHTHNWSAWSVTAATCTTSGSQTRTCSAAGCSIGTQTEEIPALGHSWGSWVITTPATDETEGSKYRECSRCHEKETVTIPATGKLPSGYTLLESISSGSGQYINTGVSAQNGLVAEVNFKIKSISTEKNNIVLGAYASGAEAYVINCTKDKNWSASLGSETRASGGNATVGTTYAITATISSGNKIKLVVNDNTVVEKSYTTGPTSNPLYLFARNYNNSGDNPAFIELYSAKIYAGSSLLRDFRPCKNASGVAGLYDMANGKFYPSEKSGTQFNAGDPVTPPTPTHTHTWSAWQTDRAATCEVAGSEYRTCSAADCPLTDRKETRTIAALGHAWDSGETTIKPTETSTGLKVYHCTRSGCEATKEEVLPMTGSSRLPAGYTELEYIASSDGGSQFINTELDAIPGYTFTAKIKPTKVGIYSVIIGSCRSDYDYRYYPLYINQNVWGFSSGENATSTKSVSANTDYTIIATTVADGGTLNVNGEDIYLPFTGTTVIPATGNDYKLYMFARNTGGTPGLYYVGRIYSLTVKNGSKTVADFVPCKNSSNKFGMYDIVRNKFYTTGVGDFTGGAEVKPAHTHTIVTFGAVEPTCTTGGYEAGTKCSSCGETLTQPKAIAALGHNFGSWVIVKDATETTTGTKKRTCSRCTYTEEAVIPVKGQYEYGATDTASGSYTWKNAADGVWADPANWTKSSGLTYGIPASATVAAIIPASMTSALEIDLGGASYTINNLTNNSAKGVMIANGTLINQAGKSMRTFGDLTFRDMTLKGYRIYQSGGILTFEGNNTLADGYTIHFTENKGNVLFKNGLTKVTSEFTEYSTSGLAPFKLDNARLEAVKYPGVPSDVFVTLGANNVAGQSVMKFSGEFKLPAGSKLTIDVAKAAAGTYTIVEAGTLNVDSTFITGANVVNYGTMKKSVEKVGNKIVLTLTSEGPCTHPVASLVKLEGKAATCLVAGLTEGTKCGICGETITAQEVITALGHDLGSWIVGVEATCETAGTKNLACTRCGATLDTQAIPASGHSWDNGTVTKQATTTTPGIKTFSCTVCHKTKEEIIPASDGTMATWTGNGNTNLWSVAANWSTGVPTAASDINFSGKADVELDSDSSSAAPAANAVYFTATADVTLKGGKSLYASATGLTENTALMSDGTKLTVSGVETVVNIESASEASYTLAANDAEIRVTDGATFAMHDVVVNVTGSGLATLTAEGSGSRISINAINERIAGNDFTVNVSDGAKAEFNTFYVEGNRDCTSTITIDDGTLNVNGNLALSAGTTAMSEIVLKGDNPLIMLAANNATEATFGSQSYQGHLTLTLAPTPNWSTTEPRIKGGAGQLKFCDGIKVIVDCAAFGTSGTWKFPIVAPGSGGVKSDRYTAPKSANVMLENGDDCTATFSLENNIIYLTITSTAKPVAKIGEKYFATIKGAIDAAKANENIVLVANVAADASLYIGKDITISLNGYTLTGNIKHTIGSLTIDGANESEATSTIVGNIEVGSASAEDCNFSLRGVVVTGSVKTVASKDDVVMNIIGSEIVSSGVALDLAGAGEAHIDTTTLKGVTGIEVATAEVSFTSSAIDATGDGIVVTGAAALHIGDGSAIDSGATAVKANAKLSYLAIGDNEATEPIVVGKTAAINASATEAYVVSGIYSHEVPEALLGGDYTCIEKDGLWRVVTMHEAEDDIPQLIADAKSGDTIDLPQGFELQDDNITVIIGGYPYKVSEHYIFKQSGTQLFKVIDELEAEIAGIDIDTSSDKVRIGTIKNSFLGFKYRLIFSTDPTLKTGVQSTAWQKGNGGLLELEANVTGEKCFYRIEVTDED